MVSTNDRARPRGPRSRGRFLVLVVLLAIGLQVPLVAALAHLGGRLAPVIAVPALLTAAFIGGMVRGRTAWATPSPLRLYLVLWPFFIWWTIALLFSFAAPLALALGLLLHASTDAALVAALVAAIAGAALSLHQRPRIRRRDVEIDALPESFDGYRIVQISDLHCGPFASGRRVARWVAAANRLDPDLVETNIVVFGVDDAFAVSEALGAHDVWIGALDATTMRAVTHLDVDPAGVERALRAMTDVLA